MNVQQKVKKDTQIKIIRNAALLNNQESSIKPLLESLEYANKGSDYTSLTKRLKNTLKVLKETPLNDKDSIRNLIKFYIDNLTLKIQASVILDLLEDSINNINKALEDCGPKYFNILEYKRSLQLDAYNVYLKIERNTL